MAEGIFSGPGALDRRGLDRYARLGLILVIALLVVGGGWAILAQLQSAVIATGTIVVESSAKRVQHKEGGIVAEIRAFNEDRVAAGDVLVRLDDTALKASLTVVNNQLDLARAVEARLVAEISGAEALTVPPELEARTAEPFVEELVTAQSALMEARRQVRAGNITRLNQQISQIESRIGGLETQETALSAQLDVIIDEQTDLNELLADQLVEARRLNEMARERARLEGEMGTVQSSIAESRSMIVERRGQIEQERTGFLSENLDALQGVRERIAELLQQKIAGEDRLARIDIVAPTAGIVHESIVHTVGGVVGAAETLMMIVPYEDDLVVELPISPLDVDELHVGQNVIVRISSFNARTAPDLQARIIQVSPDLSQDPETGLRFFLARARFEPGTLDQLGPEQSLVPGMPAEAYVQTGNRTVLDYLLQPLTEQFRRAMRES